MTKREAEYYCRFRERLNRFEDFEIDWLHRSESTLRRIFTNQCNGYADYFGNQSKWDLIREKKEEEKENRLTARIKKLVESKGYFVKLNGDPRGCAIHIYLTKDDMDKHESNYYYIGW